MLTALQENKGLIPRSHIGCLQQAITPVLGDPAPSFGLCGHYTVCGTVIYRGKTPIHINNKVVALQACYGILKVPEGSWLCRTCALGVQPKCLLCPKKGGAMKPTRSGTKWVHVSCALWIPEVSLLSDSILIETVLVSCWGWVGGSE